MSKADEATLARRIKSIGRRGFPIRPFGCAAILNLWVSLAPKRMMPHSRTAPSRPRLPPPLRGFGRCILARCAPDATSSAAGHRPRPGVSSEAVADRISVRCAGEMMATTNSAFRFLKTKRRLRCSLPRRQWATSCCSRASSGLSNLKSLTPGPIPTWSAWIRASVPAAPRAQRGSESAPASRAFSGSLTRAGLSDAVADALCESSRLADLARYASLRRDLGGVDTVAHIRFAVE